MRVQTLAWLAALSIVIVACTSVAPQASPLVSTPVSSSSVPTESAPATSDGPASIAPDTAAPETATPTATATDRPRKSPRPTKEPSATPSPTPERTPADAEVSFEQSTIPNPFYNNTDYTIRVYVSALGTQNLPSVHLKLVATDEGVSLEYDTGPIAIADNYYHDFEQVNLPAIGPSTLIVTATLPSDYRDTNKANNIKSVDITVTLAP